MIDLKKIFINHFDAEAITDYRLKAFSLDHIYKLTAWLTVHTDAELSDLRNELIAKYNLYFGAIADENTKLNIQRGRTLSVNKSWKAVLNFIRRHEGTIRGLWGKNSPQYKQFYPHGLDEYNHATRLNKDKLLVRYLAVASNHAANLPPDFVADFTALKNNWTTKFTAQQQQIGLVKDADSQIANTRVGLEDQLSLNMLIIASKNIGYPGRMGNFFNQSIIRRKRYGKSVPATSLMICGKVMESGTSTPVVNVPVSVQGKNIPHETTATDENGQYNFSFHNVNPAETGSITVSISAPGFQYFKKTIQAEAGNIYVVDASLVQELQLAA